MGRGGAGILRVGQSQGLPPRYHGCPLSLVIKHFSLYLLASNCILTSYWYGMSVLRYPWRIKAAGGLLEASALYKTETCRSISESGQKREREEAGALETH